MGDVPKSRSWYRLHLLTWVLICCVTGSVVVENMLRHHDYVYSTVYSSYTFGMPSFVHKHGWPISYLVEYPLVTFYEMRGFHWALFYSPNRHV